MLMLKITLWSPCPVVYDPLSVRRSVQQADLVETLQSLGAANGSTVPVLIGRELWGGRGGRAVWFARGLGGHDFFVASPTVLPPTSCLFSSGLLLDLLPLSDEALQFHGLDSEVSQLKLGSEVNFVAKLLAEAEFGTLEKETYFLKKYNFLHNNA